MNMYLWGVYFFDISNEIQFVTGNYEEAKKFVDSYCKNVSGSRFLIKRIPAYLSLYKNGECIHFSPKGVKLEQIQLGVWKC